MNSLYIEIRKLESSDSLAQDLAHGIYTNHTFGNIAVVSEQPIALMRSVQKQWLKYIREIEQKSPDTLDDNDSTEINRNLNYVQNLTFSAESPDKDIQASVSFSTAKEFRLIPPICRTLYVTSKISQEDTYLITSWMPSHALVILYKVG